MLPFRLTCLGQPQLVGPDGDAVRFRTRKHLGLLVFLAIEPALAHRRDRLATLLWPGVELDEARHSLATALSVLRGRLGADAFEATRDTVRLLPGRVVSDVSLLITGDELEGDALVAGPFLEEFEIPRAPDFQHWVDTERARLLPAVHDHLVRRLDHCRRTGDTRRLEATAEQLRRVDPLSEHATRALVEARAMSGDRIGALRLYDNWRDRLAEELGAVPGRELERMAERLRRRGIDRPARALVAPVPTEQWQERTFVGRNAEYQACYALWERASHGEARHVLVRGESGIGKTTLAGRVATSLALEGAAIARVQCYELERELPFGMAGSLVAGLLDLPGAGATSPGHLAELGRLVPKVRQRWTTLPEPVAVSGESARIQFTEAVMALLEAVAGEQPLVVVIDDLHLSDSTSLAVLHLVLRRVEQLPLMVLMTASSDDKATPTAAVRFHEQAAAIRTTVLLLGPLPTAHASDLLEATLAGGAEPGPTVRRAVLSAAGGNPMMLELLVGDWRRRGDASLALALTAMTREAAPSGEAAVRRLVDGMLGALDRESRAVADLAAILGQRLNDLAMYTLVDLPVARTMRAMAALTGHRVLRDAGSHLEFANEVVRGQCYLAMAAPMRRMLHSLVADRLLAEEGVGAPIPGLEVAWHLVRGDRLPEAVPHLLAGGREAIRRGAPHEADLALSTGLPALTGAPRRTAILLLAEALQELGRWTESLRVLEADGEEFEEAEECWREVLRITGRRWNGTIPIGSYDAHIAILCRVAHQPIPPEIRVKALTAIPYLLSQSQDARSMALFGSTLGAFDQSGLTDYDLLSFLVAAAWWQERANDRVEATRSLDRAISIVRKGGFGSSTAIRALIGAGVLRSIQGNYSAALPLLEEAVKLAYEIDNPVHVSTAAASLAVAASRLGDHHSQFKWACIALEQLGPADCSILSLAATYEKALSLAILGRDNEALAAIASIEPRHPARQPRWHLQCARLMKADVLAYLGEASRATRVAKKALAMGERGALLQDIAGMHARWLAATARIDGQELEVIQLLSQRACNPQCLHERDRAELLAALLHLQERAGLDTGETRSALGRSLNRLPEAALLLTRKMGLLQGSGKHFTDWRTK